MLIAATVTGEATAPFAKCQTEKHNRKTGGRYVNMKSQAICRIITAHPVYMNPVSGIMSLITAVTNPDREVMNLSKEVTNLNREVMNPGSAAMNHLQAATRVAVDA